MIPSPAKVLRQCLVDLGLVVNPGGDGQLLPYNQLPNDGSVLCYVGKEPDAPDQVVTLYNTGGVGFGRFMQDGRYMRHRGVQLRVRALDEDTGYDLAARLAYEGLDKIGPVKTTIDGVDHYVQNVYRTSEVISLGEEVDKRRQLYTINARVVLADIEANQG